MGARIVSRQAGQDNFDILRTAGAEMTCEDDANDFAMLAADGNAADCKKRFVISCRGTSIMSKH